MNKRSQIVLGGVASLAAFGLAMPVLAHDPPETKRVERVIVLDGEKGGHDRRAEVIRLRDRIRCEGERTEIDERTGDSEHTRILLCSDDKLKDGERAARLEKTLQSLRENDQLSAEHRAKVEAALQSAIAKLRESQ